MLAQYLQMQNQLTLTGVKVNGVETSFPISFIDIGEYLITPIVTQADTHNYVDINADPEFVSKYSRTFKITKQKLLASDFNWEGSRTQTYGDTFGLTFYAPSEVSFEYVTDLSASPRKITNSATDAGLYLAKVTISYDTTLYEIVGIPELEIEWEITKRAITLDGASWYFGGLSTTNPVITYENSHLVRPTLLGAWGYDITTTYYNSDGQEISESGTLELGTYKAVVVINYDTANYYLEFSDLEFEWTVVKGNY